MSTFKANKNQTCLIVEDHIVLRDMLCQWLELVFPLVEFIGLETGEQAIEMVQSRRIVAILMDMSLPGINGIETTRLIKKEHPDIFIFIHTINDGISFHKDAHQAGANEYFIKGRSPNGVIAAFSKVLENGHTMYHQMS